MSEAIANYEDRFARSSLKTEKFEGSMFDDGAPYVIRRQWGNTMSTIANIMDINARSDWKIRSWRRSPDCSSILHSHLANKNKKRKYATLRVEKRV